MAVVAICLLCTAYLAEIVRSGLESVPRAQIEAAEVMNFPRWRIVWTIVLPQSWKVILPAAIAYMVMFVKDTALASQAGVFELMFAGKALVNRGLDPFIVFAAVLFAYFVISWPLGRFGAWLMSSQTPKLLIYFDPGAIVPPEAAHWMQANYRNIEIRYGGAARHFAQEDQPDAIGRHVADWLRSLDQ